MASAKTFTLVNHCPYTVWPGTILFDNLVENTLVRKNTPGNDGFALTPNASRQLTAQYNWSARFWARTHCAFDSAGNGHCATGDCGGLRCLDKDGGGKWPVTSAEFSILGTPIGGGVVYYDHYYVSIVEGYNVGLAVTPTGGGIGECRYSGCSADLNAICPPELRVTDPAGTVVACKSACVAFNTAEHCCLGDYGDPLMCPVTKYSELFRNACPGAYRYSYTEPFGTATCSGSDYIITFCPK